MKKSICVHTLDIENYFPELKELTLPTIEKFCKKIKANLNIISERKISKGNLLFEKLQVYESGMSYDFNIFLDLDILVHPLCYNPFEKNIPLSYVAFKDNYDANTQLKPDKYFEQDGRNIGISACAVFTTRFTHVVWKPIEDLTIDQINQNILTKRKCVDEYTLSRNFAKYGFKYIEPYPINEYNYLFHLGTFTQDQDMILDRAKIWYNAFWK